MTGVLEKPHTEIDPDELAARVVLAQQTYHDLGADARQKLQRAAFYSKKVREGLTRGFWDSVGEGLRDLHQKFPDQEWASFASQINRLTPNALEGVLPRS